MNHNFLELLMIVCAASTSAWLVYSSIERKQRDLYDKVFPFSINIDHTEREALGNEDDIKDRPAWERLNKKLQPDLYSIRNISGWIAVISVIIILTLANK